MASTPAERQRAYRERKAAKRNAVTSQPVTPVTPVTGVVREQAINYTRARTGSGPNPRVVMCPPCAPDQYALARSMMLDGATTKQLQCATGAHWHAIEEYGLQLDPHNWPAALTKWQARRAQVIMDKAQRVAMQDDPAVVTDGPMGRVEQRRTDPAMIAQLMQGLQPEIHGKLAGVKQQQAQQQAVNVTIVMGGTRRDVDEMPTFDVKSQNATRYDALQDDNGDGAEV